jgi:hypothetical protein
MRDVSRQDCMVRHAGKREHDTRLATGFGEAEK